MALDLDLTIELIAEALPAAERQAHVLGLALQRGEGQKALDFYIPFAAPDAQQYLVRLRCDGYDALAPSFQFVNPTGIEQTGAEWWPRMNGLGYPRSDQGEVVYCTPGIREYHQHMSHRGETYPKTTWCLARVVALTWRYFRMDYGGRGGV